MSTDYLRALPKGIPFRERAQGLRELAEEYRRETGSRRKNRRRNPTNGNKLGKLAIVGGLLLVGHLVLADQAQQRSSGG